MDDLISEESEDEGPRAMPDRLPPRAPERAQPAPEKKSSPGTMKMIARFVGEFACSLIRLTSSEENSW